MKTLIIMRHGEAVAGIGQDGDYARALTEAGRLRVAQQVQRLLASAWPVPTDMRVSSAGRTSETAAIVASVLAKPINLKLSPDLYRANADGYLASLQTLSEDLDQVMVVGHNPAVSDLVQTLTQTASLDLPPAGLCVLQTEQSWCAATAFRMVACYID